MKLKKIKRMVVAGTAILMTLSLAGCGIGSDSVKLGAAGVGGGYYAFSNAFAQIASSEDEDLDFEVKATAGSTANIRLLSDGYVDMAIAQADLVDAAYNGTCLLYTSSRGSYTFPDLLTGYRRIPREVRTSKLSCKCIHDNVCISTCSYIT